MAQASSWLQQLFNWIESSLLVLVKGRLFQQLYSYRMRGVGSWLLILTGIIAMLLWNWKLLLATGAGVLAMLLVYLMQDWNWKPYWSSLRQFFSGSHRQLTLAVGSGGIATLTTYMAVSIWVDSDSPWIAAGAIVQGFGTLATFLLLVWQIIISQASQEEAKRDQLLSDLTEADSVKRLLAVRRLTDWGSNKYLHPSTQRVVADCFRLMLNQEQESIIRDAVLDGLMVLDNHQNLGKGAQPFQTPITLQQSTTKVHHI